MWYRPAIKLKSNSIYFSNIIFQNSRRFDCFILDSACDYFSSLLLDIVLFEWKRPTFSVHMKFTLAKSNRKIEERLWRIFSRLNLCRFIQLRRVLIWKVISSLYNMFLYIFMELISFYYFYYTYHLHFIYRKWHVEFDKHITSANRYLHFLLYIQYVYCISI